MSSELNVIEANGDHALGRWGGVLLHVWRGRTTRQGVSLFFRSLAEMKARGEGPIALFGAIEPQAEPIDRFAVELMGTGMSALEDGVLASAMVCEASGLSGAPLRAIVSAVEAVALVSFPHRLFATMDEGAAFLSSHLRAAGGPENGAEDFVDALRRLRST